MLIQPPPFDPTATNPRPRDKTLVETKYAWSDDWQPEKYWDPLRCKDCASPGVPDAHIRFRSGNIKREDATAFAVENPQESGILRTFVRISIIPGNIQPIAGAPKPVPIFVGRIYELETDVLGPDVKPANTYTTDQAIVARGLVHELERIKLSSSWITNDNATALQVQSVIPFNDRYHFGFDPIGNRSGAQQMVNGKNTYVFGQTVNPYSGKYQTWSAADIINYVLTCFGPADIPFVLADQSNVLAGLTLPHLDVDRMTIKELLDTLIDRRRGLVWCLRTSGSGNVEVYVNTVLETAISVDGFSIPANTEIITIDTTPDPQGVIEMKTQTDDWQRYGTIVVSGAPIVTCFSVSFADGTLKEGWTSAQAQEYNALGPDDPIKAARLRADTKYEHVYTTFKIPATWNWMAGDGEGGTKNPASPILDTTGRDIQGKNAPARTWGKTLLRSLPIPKDQANWSDPDGLQPEYLAPFVLVYNELYKVYEYAHDPGSPWFPHAQIRNLDQDFGFEVKYAQNETLALNHWVFAGSEEALGADPSIIANPSDKGIPEYDYTKMIATVACRTDTRAQTTVTIPGQDPDRVLYINVDDAEFWYVVPGTVTGLGSGGALNRLLTIAPNVGGIYRNDTATLRTVAAMAKAWYGTARSVMTLSMWNNFSGVGVGKLVSYLQDKISTYDVHTVVTEIEWDLQEMKTTIQTHFAELDFTEIVPLPTGMGTIR